MNGLVPAMTLTFTVFAQTAITDPWRDNGSWVVRDPGGFGCQHRGTLDPLYAYAHGNDRRPFEHALDQL